MQFWRPATLLKKTLTKILSCKIWEIFKNNYFEEHLWTTACKLYLKKRRQHRCFLCELFKNTYLQRIYERLVPKHQCGGFSFTACRPLRVLERDSGTGISVNYLEKLFRGTPPLSHFSLNVVLFFLTAD